MMSLTGEMEYLKKKELVNTMSLRKHNTVCLTDFARQWVLLGKFGLGRNLDWDVGNDFSTVPESRFNDLTLQDGLLLDVNLLVGFERHSHCLWPVVHVQGHLAGIHCEQVPGIGILGVTVIKHKAERKQGFYHAQSQQLSGYTDINKFLGMFVKFKSVY